jgi:hypothetical protein
MTRKIFISTLFVFILLAGWMLPVQAQQAEFSLSVHRNFGYSSGSQIRGNFNLDIVGAQTIKSVTYLIDGSVISQVTSSPFSQTIQTSDYALGWHDLSAIVETLDGRKVTTASRRFEFASAEQESSGTLSIVGPLLGGVVLLFVLIVGFQMLFTRNKPKATLPLGESRRYGIRGGSVCPHCHRAVSLHWWALNIGLGAKFDRCDFCGKWSILKALSSKDLAAAEAAELQMAQPTPVVSTKSEKNVLDDLIDKSRYIDQ